MKYAMFPFVNTGAGEFLAGTSLTLTKTGLAAATSFTQITGSISVAAGTLGANNTVGYFQSITSGGLDSAGGALVGQRISIRPHASDTGNMTTVGTYYGLDNTSGVANTTAVGSGTNIGIFLDGKGWGVSMMSSVDDIRIASGQMASNQNGANLTLVAGDGAGTSKNGGTVTISAGNKTSGGSEGAITLNISGDVSTGPAAYVQFAINSVAQMGFGGNTNNGGVTVPIADGANWGLGKVNAPAQISAGATLQLTAGTSKQVQYLDFAAGGGAYTYNVDLLKGSGTAIIGSVMYFNIVKAASTNPTITFRNGSGGSTIISINNGTAQNIYVSFIFNGTDWKRLAYVVNAA